MQIKQLARATGADLETIRYYEKQGLLPEPARRDNGYPEYRPRTWIAFSLCAIAVRWTCRWPM